jgi:hypothetical protein
MMMMIGCKLRRHQCMRRDGLRRARRSRAQRDRRQRKAAMAMVERTEGDHGGGGGGGGSNIKLHVNSICANECLCMTKYFLFI